MLLSFFFSFIAFIIHHNTIYLLIYLGPLSFIQFFF